MSKTCKTPEVIPDVLVLAAVERAVRHRARAGNATPIWEILRHLDIPVRSGAARRVRARVDELTAGGLLVYEPRRGRDAWRLTPNGRRRLRRARGTDREPRLPESPQHQAWRSARERSADGIERNRDELRMRARRVLRLLDSEGVSSDAWFELAYELRRFARIVGSMTHCLGEWQEPEDAKADREDYAAPGDEKLTRGERAVARSRRTGRRNPGLWHP